MDTRAVWQYDPLRAAWGLWLVRGVAGSGLGYEVALRTRRGTIEWAQRDPAVRVDDPPLVELEDWLLREVVLPAAPGAPKASQAAGRVEALEDALYLERERVDKVLDAAIAVGRR